MDPVVVVMGGSVVAPADPDPGFLRALARRVAAWRAASGVYLVVGGGHAARRSIAFARELGASEVDLDRVGIAATRLNAHVLRCVLSAHGVPVAPEVPATVAQAVGWGSRGVVVMGGTEPGHSTDEVGARLAAAVGAARLVVATNVDGVYDRDPREDPAAEHREHLSFEELLGIVGDGSWVRAGASGVVDGPASRVIAEHRLRTLVLDGRDLENLDAAVQGKGFNGSVVGDPA